MEDERIARTVLLPLAEKMVSTFAAKNSFGASGGTQSQIERPLMCPSELELYVMILDVLQKYRDAVDAMESHGEGLVSRETVQHRSLGMLLKAGNHAEVVERSLVILSNKYVAFWHLQSLVSGNILQRTTIICAITASMNGPSGSTCCAPRFQSSRRPKRMLAKSMSVSEMSSENVCSELLTR